MGIQYLLAQLIKDSKCYKMIDDKTEPRKKKSIIMDKIFGRGQTNFQFRVEMVIPSRIRPDHTVGSLGSIFDRDGTAGVRPDYAIGSLGSIFDRNSTRIRSDDTIRSLRGILDRNSARVWPDYTIRSLRSIFDRDSPRIRSDDTIRSLRGILDWNCTSGYSSRTQCRIHLEGEGGFSKSEDGNNERYSSREWALGTQIPDLPGQQPRSREY
jgi:hypothetical protein